MKPSPSSCSEGGGVDHKAILHIRLHHTVVGLRDLIAADDLMRAGDVVLSAEVQHLLRLTDAADEGSRDGLSLGNDGKGMEVKGLSGSPHHHKLAVLPQEVEVGGDVMLCRDGVDDHIQAGGSRLHILLIGHHLGCC